jgi:hypothetical protein
MPELQSRTKTSFLPETKVIEHIFWTKDAALQDIFSWLVKMLNGVSLSVRSLASELAREPV